MMGTSCIDYRDLEFWARDETVELWLHLLVIAIDGSSPSASWLSEARGDWYLQATAGFQGCVAVDLEAQLARDPHRETEFLALLDQVRAVIASYGARMLPRATDTWRTGGGRQLGEVDAEILQRFTDAISGLVRHQVAWDTSARVPGIWAGPDLRGEST